MFGLFIAQNTVVFICVTSLCFSVDSLAVIVSMKHLKFNYRRWLEMNRSFISIIQCGHFKKLCLLTTLLILSVTAISSLTLINENIQNWTAYTSYGTYTQTIPAGIITMTRCIVSPGAAATGTCSSGRIQMEAANGILDFPELPSVGQVEFHMAAGSSGRSIKLQFFNGAAFEDLITFTGIATTGASFFYEVNFSEPTTLRLASPSHAVYVHDIVITDYQVTELPLISTTAVSNITYNSAVSGGNIENSGAAQVTSRGVCWSESLNPTLDNSFTVNGTGIGTFTSNITGLTSATTYNVRAYATNSFGTAYGENIQFITANVGVPSVQASNLVFFPGSNSIQATWTPGNGAKRIVKINTVNSFTNPPENVFLTPNTVYAGAGEQVVYNGATQIIEGQAVNSVSVTGLTPNTTYWLRVYDYNYEDMVYHYNTTIANNNPRSTTTLNTVLTGYYEGIEGTGTALKTDLHNLLRTTHLTAFSYDALWTQLQYTDEDSVNTNNIIQIYTGWSIPKSYSGGGVDQWNREHVWSKSHGDFGDVPKAGTDLHHLRPCDSTVNSAKGNKDFDNGGTPYTDASPYPGYSGVTGCYTSTNSWEPRNEDKGDVARMILYMAVRYEGTDTTYDLEMQDITPTVGPFYGKLSTLLNWHVTDPPNGWERRRNNRIHERQGNRNPFIDHPQFVNQIWAPTATYAEAVDSITFIARWSQAVNAQSYVLDVASDSQFSNIIPGYSNLNVGNTTTRTVTVPQSNAIYYYRLRSFFTSGYSMNSNVAAVYVSSAPVVLTDLSSTWDYTENLGYFVQLSWTTQYENELSGYQVYRGLTDNLNTAQNVTTDLIPATNTNTPHTYYYTDPNLVNWTMYYYWIKYLSLDSSYGFWGPDSVYVGEVSNEDQTSVPVVRQIRSVYPNPFNLKANIEIDLSNKEFVNLQVFNLKGQMVKTLFSGTKTSGQHIISWDGTDLSGAVCPSGIYLVRLQTANHSSHKKVLRY